MSSHFLETSLQEFKKYKGMGDRSIAQLHSDEEMHWAPTPESNSMATLIRHLHGNMKSRFTDFLTTDGEKPDRHRDNEFIEARETKEQLIALWNAGWQLVFDTMESLTAEDEMRTIYIRGEAHTVMQAIIRQISHYCGHVGQMIYVAKQIRDSEWNTLSIARGKSEEFNRQMLGK